MDTALGFMYRELTTQEEADFRLWARHNYIPFDEISNLWHPIAQHECACMNVEAYRKHYNQEAVQ